MAPFAEIGFVQATIVYRGTRSWVAWTTNISNLPMAMRRGRAAPRLGSQP